MEHLPERLAATVGMFVVGAILLTSAIEGFRDVPNCITEKILPYTFVVCGAVGFACLVWTVWA